MSSYGFSIIIPTFNESKNIAFIIESIMKVLDETVTYEIIIVDDNSSDKTWDVADQYAQKYVNITCFRRISKKGLSSAVIDGFMLAKGEFVGVIDADMQHDESILPKMLEHCFKGMDLAIGSRYCKDGSTGLWGKGRRFISLIATKIGQSISTFNLSDPMSGFFIIRKSVFLSVVDKLHVKGYKILLDIVSQLDSNKIKLIEVPYTFRNRNYGESKLTPKVVFQLIDFVYLKIAGDYLPINYIKFVSVGAFGATIHFSILYLFYIVLNNNYNLSLIVAIEAGLLINYFMNNLWTFKIRAHKGLEIFFGLIKFNILSGIGGVMSYYISTSLFESEVNWAFASIIGAIVASLWNYNLNKILTWKIK